MRLRAAMALAALAVFRPADARAIESEVMSAMRAEVAAIDACYAEALLRDPELQGSLTLAWTIDLEGEVRDIGTESAVPWPRSFERCLAGIAATLRFEAPPVEPLQVRFPLHFEAGSSAELGEERPQTRFDLEGFWDADLTASEPAEAEVNPVDESTLTRADVDDALAAASASLDACYAREAARLAGQTGRVVLRVGVNAAGVVDAAEVVGTPLDARLAACCRAVAEELVFPTRGRGTDLTLPLTFPR